MTKFIQEVQKFVGIHGIHRTGATRLGIDRVTLYRLNRGADPSLKIFLRVCRRLGLDEASLAKEYIPGGSK